MVSEAPHWPLRVTRAERTFCDLRSCNHREHVQDEHSLLLQSSASDLAVCLLITTIVAHGQCLHSVHIHPAFRPTRLLSQREIATLAKPSTSLSLTKHLTGVTLACPCTSLMRLPDSARPFLQHHARRARRMQSACWPTHLPALFVQARRDCTLSAGSQGGTRVLA